MFGSIVKVMERWKAVREAARKAAEKNLFHAAAGIRKDEIASIQKSPFASDPGSPPHTRRKQLPNAIIFNVDKAAMSAVIGPRGSRVGTSAAAHEFGGDYRGQAFPKRSFARPAMEGRLKSFAGSFAGSIGE